MPRDFQLSTIPGCTPSGFINCERRGPVISAVRVEREGSFRLDQPTVNYKTGIQEYSDQVWHWVPAADSWLRNRDRVARRPREEMLELYQYVRLLEQLSAERQRLLAQGEVNEFITQNDMWGEFPLIRSMNTHNPDRPPVPGVTPQHFAILRQMGVGHGAGHPLTSYERY